MVVPHWLIHFFGIDYGVTYGHWIWYNMWSGVGGSFLVNLLVFMAVFYGHHTCQAKINCLRWGKYPAADGLFKLCHVHHPDIQGGRPRHAMILKMHEESKKN